MKNDKLLKLLANHKMSDKDAVSMIFSNFIDIGGTHIGLTVENAIMAGELLREYDRNCALKAPPERGERRSECK
jgi:hypothetical protein